MNKIFKVVWSKTKECYVVVSEVAKNNGGKKKVLASVLAGLAMVGAGAAGTPVQADVILNNSAVNVQPDSLSSADKNKVSKNSVVVGYGNDTTTGVTGNGHIAIGANNKSTKDSSIALGNKSEATAGAAIAIGTSTIASGDAAVGIGNLTQANGFGSIAIGTRANYDSDNNTALQAGKYSVAVGARNRATGENASAFGFQAQAIGKQTTAIGNNAVANGSYSTAVGTENTANGATDVAMGVNNKVLDEAGVQSNYSSAVGSSNTIKASSYASAFGRENKVVGEGSTAIGYSNLVGVDRTSGNTLVDAGTGATGAGKATAIGYQSEARGNRNVAIGNQAIAQRDDSVAIGSEVQALSGHNIAIGSKSVAQASTDQASVGIAIGLNVKAVGQSTTDKDLIAIGNSSNATANGAVAIGSLANATGRNSYAMGNSATASASGAVAIGQVAGATGHGATAFGNGAQSYGIGSTGIGRLSYASENGATAIGANSAATGYNSIAIGADEVTGTGNLDYVNNNFKTPGATADTIGSTRASGKYAVALSTEARASKDDAVAIGHKATASIAGGVALGSESKTTKDAGEIGYNPAAGRTNKYDNLTNNTKAALTSTRAAVSIGDDSTSVTRQLTGLAAGTQDTDAVNVAQLKAVNLKFAGDSTQVTGSTDVRLNDGTFNVNGDGTLISTEATATGIKVKAKVGGTINNTDGKAVKPTTNGIATTDNVADAINDSYWKATAGGNTDGTPAVGKVKPGTQVTYSAGDNLKVKQTINNTTGDQEYKYSLNPVLTGITSIANTATGPKMTFGGNSINITGGSLDMGNNKITNLATGTDDKDAVNVKQLKDTEIHITPGTYTPDSNKKVTLTYENGDNKTVAGKTAVIDLSGLATGGTASTEKVQKAADAANDTNIAEVNPKTGDTFGGAGATYEVSVSRNAVKDAAREAVTINNGGTKSGTTYTPNADNPITVTPKEDAANHNTTYEVTFDGNKAAKQIPLTYKATNNGTTTADQTVKLDKGLNFTGGNYTTASVGADGKVTFDVNLGTAPTVTDGKPGVPGQAGAAGKDGIATVKTVVDTINNSGWKANAKANGGTLVGSSTATVVKPGDQVNFAAGKNLTVKQDLTGEHTYTYSLNKDIDLTNAGSLTVGDTTVNNGGITIKAPTPAAGTTPTTDVKLTNTGLDNGGNKITNVAEGTNNTDAVNVKQLKANRTEVKAGDNVVVTTAADPTDNHTVYTVNAVTPAVYTTPDGDKLTKDKDGKFHKVGETAEYTGDIITSFENPKAAAGQTTKDGVMIVNNIGSAIKNQTPTMPAGQTATYLDKLKAAADNNSNVKNAAVNVSDLHNTAEALKANELHIRPTASNRAGETVNKNTAGTADEVYKYDATTKSVTLKYNDGTGAGVTGTEAKIDLSDLANQITSGYTFKANATANGGKVDGTATATAVENGGTINYTAGKNLTVKQDIDATNKTHTYTYSLDKDLTNLDKVVVNGENGTNGKDGVTIIGPQGATGATGMPGTNGIDGKVGITGKDGKDAVSIAGKDGVGTIGLTGPQGPAGTNGKSVDISTENGTQTLVKPEANNNNQSQRIVYVPKDANGNPLKDDAGNTIKREVATMDDGLKFTGNNESTVNKHNLGSLVKVQGEGTKEGTNAAGTKEIQTSDGTKFESAKDNIAVEANNGDTLTVKLNKNLKGLDSVQTKTVELGDHTTPGSTTNITYNPTDKRIEYTTPGTTQTKKVATTDDIWTIQGDGTDVAPVGGKVNVKAGENILITTPTTADGSMTINAVTPAVYTDKNGNKLTKDKDGKFHKPDGTEVAAADVITSIQDASGNVTGGNSIVNNVGSAIKNAGNAGDSFLTKLDAANTTTPNAAVNVSDLKNTADGLTNKGLRFDANEGNEKTNKLGSKVTVQGTGALSTGKAYADEYNTANIRTKIEQGTDGNTTINVGLAKALKDINSISNGGSSITISDVPAGATTPAVTISGGNLSMGNGTTNNKIVNLAPGTDGTDAVNVKQLKDTELHITPGTYTPGADKKVKLTYTDGNNAVVTGKEAVIDLSGLSTGGTTASSWNVKSSANTTDGGAVADNHNANAQNIADGKSVEFQSGKNLVVKQTNDTANGNATVEFSLSDNITAGKNGANGKDGSVGVTGKDGSSVVINGADGSIGMTGPKGQDGKAGINGRDGANLSMTSAKGEQVLVNRDPAHNADTDKAERIVYVPKDASGNPIQDANGKNIVREVATMDDGLKFTGNNESIENKHKLGSLVKVQGEGVTENTTTNKLEANGEEFKSASGNIAVVADSIDKLTVKLNKNLKGLDSVQTKTVELGDHTTPGGTTNITYNSGDKRIEYTTPGATAGTTETKKVATTDDIWTIQGNGTDVAPVNGKVNVKAGENILITTPATADGSMTINAVTPAVYTDKNGNKLTKDKDGKFHKPDGTEVAAADVITSIQDASGNVTGGNSIVNNVGSAIKNLGNTGDNYLTKLDLANTATPNAAVNVSDLKNTADALKSNELHIRPTTSGRTGETVNKNTAGTAESYKYDAATKSVTLKYNDGTGAGVTGTEAKIDLSGLADQITSGYTFSTNAKGNLADGTTATATAVGNGKTVSFAAGKNLTVEQNINATTGEHTYTYALSDKITAGKDGVNGKDGSVGVTGKDGSSVVINGADGSIGMTGPKGQDGKDGINGRDGANLSMTSAKGEQVLVNRDPAHNADTDKAERIVYVPKDASGNPIQDANGKNIVREVATMDDGLKFTGNNESTENKHKLGSLVKVQGEGVTENTTTNKLEANGEEFKSASGNIAVVADSIDKLTVKLNKNLAGINKISNGGSSITLNDNPSTTTPAVTISGGNLSMGDGTHNNKIVNVAPGTDDSDAVNYKQLKDAKTVLADGKNTKKSGTGTAADPYKVNVEGDLTEITSITNKADASGNAGKITFSPNQTVTVNGDHNITLDAGSGHIGGLTNLTFNPNSYTSGQAATEDQLKSVHDTLKANERHIAPTTVATGSTETKGGTVNAAGTANVYKYDAASKTVTLTYNDGNGHAVTDTKAVIDLSNLSTGGTGASSWNVKSSANTTDGGAVDANHNANAQNIADGKSVEFQSGKNLVVKQTNDTTNGNATVEFSLSDNITVGKDGANGKDGSVGAKGADGSAVVMNGKDGSIGLNGTNGANGISIKGKDGANGVGIDGKDGVTRIVYTEKVPDPATGTTKEVTHEVATMDDGLKFTGNNTSTENKQKLGSLVKVQGEGTKESTAVDPATGKKYVVLSDGTTKFESAKDNIAVEADGTDTLTVKLNKNLKGLNSIQLGDNTIKSNGDNIEFTTNGGITKTVATTDQLWTIQANGTNVPAKAGKVNLVAGDHITITPDAANGKMTISATGFGSMDGFNVKTSAESATVGTHAGDTTENIKNGKTVDMQAGKNLVVTQTNDGNGNTTVNYALNKDVDLGTNGSLKTGDTTINNDGFKNGNTTVGGNGMTIKDPTDPTKTVSLTKDGLNNGGNQITNVASGGNVDTNAANIGDIKRLAKDTRIKDGTYTVDNNGTVELTYVDGAGNQVKDASGNAITAKITGLTTLDSTRVNVAVNETGSGKAVGSTTPVKVTKGTEFVAGDNLIVERKAHTGNDLDNSVVYSLNKDLKGIETIKNGNTTITLHNNPTTATDPTAVTITGGNINMGGNRIVNVAPAKDGTDAVNLDQLKAARTKVTSNDGTVSVNRSENKATGEITYDLHVTPGQSPDLTRITNKVDQLGEEIGRVGAQGAALSALKPIQYDPLEPTQIMAGYGNYRGNSAVALGVAHYKNESTLIHGGVSWAGGSSHMMANAGVTWKVGNRDSEAAVADRYRKGPISSAYAMQQEMAAMKAQNAGLKGEVSDLKAENEQMKAQIAAMMAKLGL